MQKQNGTTPRNIVAIESVDEQTNEIIQRAETNLTNDLNAVEQQIQQFTQEQTKALTTMIEGAVEMVAGKDFRIEIEEEVTVIEKS